MSNAWKQIIVSMLTEDTIIVLTVIKHMQTGERDSSAGLPRNCAIIDITSKKCSAWPSYIDSIVLEILNIIRRDVLKVYLSLAALVKKISGIYREFIIWVVNYFLNSRKWLLYTVLTNVDRLVPAVWLIKETDEWNLLCESCNSCWNTPSNFNKRVNTQTKYNFLMKGITHLPC